MDLEGAACGPPFYCLDRPPHFDAVIIIFQIITGLKSVNRDCPARGGVGHHRLCRDLRDWTEVFWFGGLRATSFAKAKTFLVPQRYQGCDSHYEEASRIARFSGDLRRIIGSQGSEFLRHDG
jgi:hypothetical protein